MSDYSNSRWKERGSFNKNVLHSYQDIVDAIRNAPYGIDTREAMAQMLIFLYSTVQSMGDGFGVDMSPTDAFKNLAELKARYPNGQQGVFVTQDDGRWWFWSELENIWKDGGFYQASAPIDDIRVVDAKTTSNRNRLNDLIADFIAEVTERKKIDADLIDKVASYLTALELKEVRLKDDASNLLWDGNNYVTGKAYLPRTDKTGLEEGVPVDSSSIGFTFLNHLEEYGLPILMLESPDLLSLRAKADGKLSGVKFDYNPNGNEGVHLSGTLKSIKVQGSSSQAYPKKNYTLNFAENLQLKDTWGSQDKYVIKADWVDFSHMRNEFGAYLWGLMRKNRIDSKRDTLTDELGQFLADEEEKLLVGETTKQFATPNFGAIDSYPVLVIINGIYHGLYSMTIPKDDWMANMGSGEKEAIVSAEDHGGTTRFLKHVNADSQGNLAGSDFSVEYVSDESNQQWVVESLNRSIDSVVNTTGTVEGIRDYIDVDSATDYFILNALILNSDAFDKNFLLQTWDGKKWFFAAYDMDATFGNKWDGKAYYEADWLGFKEQESLNRVFHLIYAYDKDNFISRWETLRNGLLSNENLSNLIYNYAITIPKAAFDYEAKRWPRRPGTITNNVNQIQSWIMLRLSFLDKEINNLKL